MTKDAKKGIFPFPVADFFDKALTIGSGQAPMKRYNEYLRDLIVTGRAKPRRVVSHHISIKDAPNAYDKFDQRIDGYTKVLIRFGKTEKLLRFGTRSRAFARDTFFGKRKDDSVRLQASSACDMKFQNILRKRAGIISQPVFLKAGQRRCFKLLVP